MLDRIVSRNTSPFLRSILAFFALLIVSNLIYYAIKSRRPRNFPPGPRPLPVLGNLHMLPKTKAYLKFHEWGKKYGSIIGLKLGPQNVVILNDYKHVQELFDKRGAIYSDRPPNHIANDIIFRNQTHILFLPYGNDWRTLRKTLQGLLNVTAVDQLLPIQEAEANQMLNQMLANPKEWYNHVRRYSTSVILASVFGLRASTFESPRVKALYHVQDQLTQIAEVGATPPIDMFPFLRYLPGFLSPWRKWAHSIRRKQRELYFGLLKETRELYKQNPSLDCFLVQVIRNKKQIGLDDEHVAYLGGTLMEAGSDTTASTLLSFILAMIQYPEELAKCQEEVDKWCGIHRSPTTSDLGALTYLKATLNETLRWRPVAAGGIPHALTQDDYYDGHFLPKGTVLFANAWSIHRTSDFKSPDDFCPGRFLQNKFGTSGDFDSENDKRRVIYGFGAGRRVCSGQRIAENSLLMTMAKLVWAFDFKPGPGCIDSSVETGYFGGFLICPKRFPLCISPRSKGHEAVIRNERSESLEFLSKFKD